ncbi:histidine phosphatase family protein [Sulfitobacter sp. TSTF-M16]|uniref:Histidine phosphatase family protein n=1 Tax=Sulfitobacter aestuariivivens TaxID=2766981 RepID=A0A927D573_9RHOB|nr:histidine phosphatase family protein [Sulfitobacter aestuariivivens]MBD3663031.1 histidine phosphatase family protein [Sulfitobacter aestuariivivens]
MIPPLYILRHGETEWNAQGRLQGSFDSPLTSRGRAQARAQNRILAQRDLSASTALSSPQGRAFQTAAIALEGLVADIVTHAALREIGLGDWAGQDRAALIAETNAQDAFDLYELAPGGEGFAALHARCGAFLDQITAPSVLVTHGITSRMLRLILTGQPITALRDIAGGQGIVFYLENGIQHQLR